MWGRSAGPHEPRSAAGLFVVEPWPTDGVATAAAVAPHGAELIRAGVRDLPVVGVQFFTACVRV